MMADMVRASSDFIAFVFDQRFPRSCEFDSDGLGLQLTQFKHSILIRRAFLYCGLSCQSVWRDACMVRYAVAMSSASLVTK